MSSSCIEQQNYAVQQNSDLVAQSIVYIIVYILAPTQWIKVKHPNTDKDTKRPPKRLYTSLYFSTEFRKLSNEHFNDTN